MKRLARYFYCLVTFQLLRGVKKENSIKRLRSSGLFDEDYYHLWNRNLGRFSPDSIAHYVYEGEAEGFDPHPLFSSSYYTASNPDVIKRGANCFDHFLHAGCNEGRSPHELLDRLAVRRSGRKSSLEEAGNLLEGAKRDGELVMAAESERRERLQGEKVLGDVYRKMSGFEGPILSTDSDLGMSKTFVLVADAVPTKSFFESVHGYRLNQWIRYLQGRGERVLVVSRLSGEGAGSGTEDAFHGISNLIVIESAGVLRIRVGSFFDGLSDALTYGPWISGGGEPLVDLSEVRSGKRDGEVLPDSLSEVLMRLDRWMPETCVLLLSSLSALSIFPFLSPNVLKVLDIPEEPLERDGSFNRDLKAGLCPDSLGKADFVLVAASEFHGVVSKMLGDEAVLLVEHEFPPAYIANSACFSTDPCVLLLGLNAPESHRALECFLRLVWPSVQSECPDSRLIVAEGLGVGAPAGVAGLELFDPAIHDGELYKHCRVVVDLVSWGRSSSGVICDALSHWRPVVTWAAGMDQRSASTPTGCIPVDDAYQMSLAIEELLQKREIVFSDEKTQEQVVSFLSGSAGSQLLGERFDHFFAEHQYISFGSPGLLGDKFSSEEGSKLRSGARVFESVR